MGHRNVQGLHYKDNKKILYISEHGPKGGDEINFIDFSKNYNLKLPNFGWPISSYGDHYGKTDSERSKKKYEKAPLLKSHKKFNFIEPVKYFIPAIAPSKILTIENNNKLKILLGSMLGESILIYSIDKNNIIENEESIFFWRES